MREREREREDKREISKTSRYIVQQLHNSDILESNITFYDYTFLIVSSLGFVFISKAVLHKAATFGNYSFIYLFFLF